MATWYPLLTEPDKLGILIQCREKMDELQNNNLSIFANEIIGLLSPDQIKKLLFVGLNAIKHDTGYHKLFEIRSSINKMIEKSKPKNAKNEIKSRNTIAIIPQNASLSKTIPTDIISNHLCQYLDMQSITKFAECDRRLAVICHTPISIISLQHRYDPYQYTKHHNITIDGDYEYFLNDDMHRFRNIDKLSITIDGMIDGNIFNLCNKVRNLSIFAAYDWDLGDNEYDLSDMPLMHHLQSISWCNMGNFPALLSFLEQYKDKKDRYYNDIIYELKSISFINCSIDTIDEYNFFNSDTDTLRNQYLNIFHFLLPSQPNNLQILKFENSSFDKDEEPEFKEINDEFENIDTIKSSLSNLTGFVCSINEQHHRNHFFNLSKKILMNITSFNKLQSIHIHNQELISLYFNNNPTSSKINELCLNIPTTDNGRSILSRIDDTNLNKLCLVIDIKNEQKLKLFRLIPIIKKILCLHKLRLLLIVTKIDDSLNVKASEHGMRCNQSLDILIDFGQKLVKSFQEIRNGYHVNAAHLEKPLIFKFHIKSLHRYFDSKCKMKHSSKTFENLGNMIQNMMMNYLITFPIGNIQFKFTWNVDDDDDEICTNLGYVLQGTNRLFHVDIKSDGCLDHLTSNDDPAYCYNHIDYKRYCISAQAKHSNHTDIKYDNKWNVDCQYCCNTPWV